MAGSKLRETSLGKLLADALRREDRFRVFFTDHIAAVVPAWSSSPMILKALYDDWPDVRFDARRTDLWITFAGEPNPSRTTHLALCELTISAPFHAGQAEDYKRRAMAACSHGVCTSPATVLIAPEQYLASHLADAAIFEVTLSLEAIKAFFDEPPDDLDEASQDRYVAYRVALGQALSDAAEGYVPLQNGEREHQFRWYRSFVEDYKPHLRLKHQTGTAQAYDMSICMPFEGFGYIKHRLFETRHPARVVIELRRWVQHLSEVRALIARLSGDAIVVELPPKSDSPTCLYVRHKDVIVPALSKLQGFSEQAERVRAAVDEADSLYRWAEANSSEIKTFVAALER